MNVQGISQKGKKLCVLHELGNKTQAIWRHCEPSVGSVGNQGAKPLENLQYLA